MAKKNLPLIRVVLPLICVLFFAPEAQAVDLKFAHYFQSNSPEGRTASHFKDLVEKNSRGEVNMRIYTAGQIAPLRELPELIRRGVVDLILVPSSYLRSFAPKLEVLDLPFLLKSERHADRTLDVYNRTGRELLDEFQRKGMMGLSFWEIGFRNITTSKRSVQRPWDLRGLKIRVSPNPALTQAFALLGARPSNIPPGELYIALQRGVLDGQEGIINYVDRLRLYEVQRYLSMTRHAYTAAVLIINLNRFKRLSRKQQTVILEASREAALYGRRRNRQLEDKNVDRFRSKGIRVLRNLRSEDFRSVVEGETRKSFLKKHGREGRMLLDQIDHLHK